MSNQIDKFKKRYPNAYKANGGDGLTPAPFKPVEETEWDDIPVFEPAARTEAADGRTALGERPKLSEDTEQIERKINTLQAMLKETAGKEFISDIDTVNLKNGSFIYDIASNTVFFENDKKPCVEFISYDDGGSLYDIHSRSIVDFALNDIANVRRCCMRNDYGRAAEIVKETLKIMGKSGGGFYYLPDNTDVFSNNIKSGFSGYTYVWRSVAAAYRYYYGGESRSGKGNVINIDVVDLFENKPVKISIRAEILRKYNNEVMFTRYRKSELKAAWSLSYVNVAKAFWEECFKEKGLTMSKEAEKAIDRLISGDATYNLLCGGLSFDLVYQDRRYSVSAPKAKEFLRRYVSKNTDAVNQLTGCVVYGDFLALAGSSVKMPALLPYAGHGEPLTRYMERKERGIPLWIETLPKLTLDRIVNKKQKRLGEYVLVEADKTVENVFKPCVVKCEEKLTLPAGHKEIRFPLTIGGITDKKYIATIKMDDELKTAAEFDVRLVYDFDSKDSYRFVLSNEEIKEKPLRIEEGEPERKNLPFVMEFSEDEEVLSGIYDEIYEGLREAEEAVDNWDQDTDRRYNDYGEPKEMRWEYSARKACRRIFLAWVGLPYKQKEQKEIREDIRQELSDILDKIGDMRPIDDMECSYVIYLIATLELISSDVQFDDVQYDFDYSAYFSKNKSVKLIDTIVTIVLCNPNVSNASGYIKAVVDRCGSDDERICRTFSLPLLANEKLLYHICEHESEYKLLSRLVKHLLNMFDRLCDELRKKPIILPTTLRKIRDAYELSLSLLKLRGTKYWSKVKGIAGALSSAKELEEQLYDKLSENVSDDPYDYFELVDAYKESADDYKWKDENLDCELLISRVTFEPADGGDGVGLDLMHPLALTAITYLEGNPNIHMVGCGLRGD